MLNPVHGWGDGNRDGMGLETISCGDVVQVLKDCFDQNKTGSDKWTTDSELSTFASV